MQSIGMFFRLAQGDAVTAIDLVGVIPTRSMATRRNQSTGKRRSSRHTNTLVGTPGHAFRGEGAFMRASDWRRPLGRRPCQRHMAARRRPDLQTSGDSKST
jgi:hypothetical protein